MAKCAPKKAAKHVAIKDLAPRKNPKGGMNKAELIQGISMRDVIVKK